MSGPEPGSGGTVGRADAGPLLDALADAHVEIRLAALEALTRLPLDRESWLGVRDFLAPALEERAAPERARLIECAARVPVASLRERLRRLAAGGGDDARRALFALAEVGDEGSLEPLLALLDEPASARDAARLLARLDVSGHREGIRRRYSAAGSGSEPTAERFWLALALARSGEPVALLHDLREETVREAASGGLAPAPPSLVDVLGARLDDEELLAELRRGPALAAGLRAQLSAESPSGTIARLLVEADEREELPGSAEVAARPEPPRTSAARRARVRAALDSYRVIGLDAPASDWQAAVAAVVEECAAESGGRAAAGMVVSDLFRRAATASEERGLQLGLGNATVIYARSLGEAYVPDLDGLLEAYRLCGRGGSIGGPGAQIAWAASRGGMAYLLAGVAPLLARGGQERLLAAALVAAAAGYEASSNGPLVGGLPARPARPSPAALIDDTAE